jgi:ABC-type glycerol-3-phosphate transport system substrate-binding protein
MPVSRRTALKTLALPVVSGLTGLGTAGCAAGTPTLNVAVVWTGWELRQFQKVMNAFTRQYKNYNIGYQLLSMGDDTSAFLGNEVTAAAQPDVALVPQPGNVLGNRGRLTPLSWPPHAADSWRGLLAGSGDSVGSAGSEYGVWYKASYKSMVWHTPDVTPPPGGWDWGTWTDWCVKHAGGGRSPLAIGAADGWVLADWFANVLLAYHPRTYQALAGAYRGLALGHGNATDTGKLWRDPAVEDALGKLADLWKTPGLFPGGSERALATQFDQSVLDVFATGEAAMVAGADYYWPIITQYTRFPPPDVRWFPFPGAAPGQSPVITAGDAAVQFARPGREQYGRLLIDWLGCPETAAIWARAGGFLSINEQVQAKDYAYYAYAKSMQVSQLRTSVLQRGAEFNMADLLSGPLGGGDGAGAWKIFTDFFTDVAVRRVSPGTAVDNAVNALAKGEGGA